MTTQTIDELIRENEELRLRLEEAEDALRALSAGEVDAVLVEAGSEQVFTLESADKPYRLLVEQMLHPAATLTADGTTIFCNRRFADLLQQPLGALLGKPIYGFVAPEGRQLMEALLRDGLAADAAGEVLLEKADGTSVPAYLGVSALKAGAFGLCLLVTDLSEQRHYDELQRTQTALRDADRRKDEFLAILAHELRNPLAPMRNAVEILKAQGQSDPELAWAQGVLDRQLLLMARLLEDLLDVSRISRKSLELRSERILLAAVLDAALETSRPLIEAEGHALTLALPPEPIHLDADPVRLAQVFANLLNNAAKYTEKGGRIRLAAERLGSEVVVSVTDSGIGIAAEVLPSIFEIFSQAKPALARSQGGLGIGLSLVKGLVDLHSGTVEARSDGPGHGSEFVVRLPVGAEQAAQESERRDEAERKPAAKCRILVVDDKRDSADSLAKLLEIMGNEAATAYDGKQAVAAAEAMRPNMVLFDLAMPKLGGYEAARQIRQQPWSEGILLVAITGRGMEEDRRRAEEAGFDRHLAKPVDPAALADLLASFC